METTIAKATKGLESLGRCGERPMDTKFHQPSTSHHILSTPEGEFMRSYSTIIAFISNDGEVVLNTNHTQSNTTNFYRCQFLGENIKETRKKIASGEYSVTDLH